MELLQKLGLKKPINAKSAIRCAFESGQHLTTLTGNRIGHTVDFRKIVSTLRDEGMSIKDYWCEDADTGKRFKMYFLDFSKNS